MKKNILLIQIEPFHSEVLGPQIEMLERNYNIFLYCTPDVGNDDLISIYHVTKYKTFLYDSSYIWNIVKKIKGLAFLSYFINLIKINRMIRKEKIHLIIFNTIPTTQKMKLIQKLIRFKKKICIIHNAGPVITTLKLTDGFERCLFLSEEVYNYCNKEIPDNIKTRFDYFIPINFKKKIEELSFEKAHSEKIVIGVIGKTDYGKRNYLGLIQTLLIYRGTNPNFKFLISGAVTEDFLKDIEGLGLEEIITYRTGYQSFDVLFSDIISADILLFLIDETVHFYSKYNKEKISGTTNMAKAFKKPVLYSKKFPIGRFLQNYGYSYEDLNDFLNKVETKEITKETILNKVIEKEYIEYQNEQNKHYLDMIAQLIKT